MIMVALIYGFSPVPTMESAEFPDPVCTPAPLNRLRRPRSELLAKSLVSAALLIPGTSTLAITR